VTDHYAAVRQHSLGQHWMHCTTLKNGISFMCFHIIKTNCV